MDALGNPIRIIITAGTVADCTETEALISGFDATHVLGDRGYDSDAIMTLITNNGMIPVIPPKKNRIVQRDYDKHLYKFRHAVENTFLKLKQWRGIATRYAKNTASFLATIQIRCLILWLL